MLIKGLDNSPSRSERSGLSEEYSDIQVLEAVQDKYLLLAVKMNANKAEKAQSSALGIWVGDAKPR